MVPLSRFIIVTAFQSEQLKSSFSFIEDDFIVCADGGYIHALKEGIKPNLVIGDFDSLDFEISEDCQVIRLAVEKDDTDTMVCLKYGIEKGFDDFYILGGLGGRLDHTIANLQTISYGVDLNKNIWIIDGKNKTTMRNPGIIEIPKHSNHKISLFTYTDLCDGVSIKGVKYPLSEHLLSNNFPLGVSNEFVDEFAQVSHKLGKLLIVISQD